MNKKKTVKAWACLHKGTGRFVDVWNSEPSDYNKQNPDYDFVPCTITYSAPTKNKN